ncbi:MAG: putative toxin-antitoxin system toxin component, PIN family [Trueperaceae bacterium]
MRFAGHGGIDTGGLTLRLVFDTNVVVSALLFEHGRLAWLRDEWRSKRQVPLISHPTAVELVRVMEYAKFRLSQADREELLGDYLPFTETIEIPSGLKLPQCRDAKDQMFIELAAAADAGALITGDPHLIDMSGDLPFEVLTPAELWAMVDRR